MNRILTVFNFLGVLTLVGLSVLQWRTNGQLTRETERLEQTRIEQSGTIAKQDQAIKRDAADLEDFRQRLAKSDGSLKDSESKLATTLADRNQIAAQRDQLTAQRDQLKDNLNKWTAAVSERDIAIKQAGQQIQRLSTERNEAIAKYNDIAGKYNQAVKDLNTARGK